MKTSPQLLLVAPLALWVGYCTLVFPSRRILTWFELCTDGFAPDWLASDTMDVVGSHWREALSRGFLKDISETVVDYLNKWGEGADIDVLEMAAGSGSAPSVWHDLFQENGLCTRIILTDIQPNAKLSTWEVLRAENEPNEPEDLIDNLQTNYCGTFSYIASPVDATQAQAAVARVIPNWGTHTHQKQVRMIHLSLHHFEPAEVQEILEDATSSNAAILIIDHSPNAGGALYNGALALKQLIKLLPGILMRNPIKVLLAPFLPIIIVGLWHDATVSILRSYSKQELRSMIWSTQAGKDYNVQTFKSASYGEWIGVPSFLQPLMPALQDNVMTFLFATPQTDGHRAPSRHADHPFTSPTIKNFTVREPANKVYGTQTIQPESPPVSASMQLVVLFFVGAVSFMYLSDGDSNRKRRPKSQGNDELIGRPAILGVGTANPPYEWTTAHVNVGIDWKRKRIDMSDEFFEFMKKVHLTSGVERRWFGVPPPDQAKLDAGIMPEGIYAKDGYPSVSARHSYWAEWAPKMAIQAATKAIDDWGGNKNNITHVIVHSCTGFKAPGIELDIIDALKLTNVKRRLGINYMGCFGGFTGMAVAKAFCEADSSAVVLLVCSETCYSHIAFSENKSKAIGNCFFADGAAAAIIGPGRPGDWAISDQQTKTLGTDTRGMMTWQPSDSCYDMYLDKSIGMSFGMHLYWNLKSYLRGICKESVTDIEWCVHPGGKAILDFFCSDKLGLGISREALDRSYNVLKNYGNMSSATIFFVLQDVIQQARERPTETKSTAVCFGFGPGLTLEIAELRRIGAEDACSTSA